MYVRSDLYIVSATNADAWSTGRQNLPIKTLRIPTTDGLADAFAAFPDRASGTPGC